MFEALLHHHGPVAPPTARWWRLPRRRSATLPDPVDALTAIAEAVRRAASVDVVSVGLDAGQRRLRLEVLDLLPGTSRDGLAGRVALAARGVQPDCEVQVEVVRNLS